jgi:hypothetical protein
MLNKEQLLDRAELSLQLAKNLEGFDDEYQLRCLKLFTMLTMCFIPEADTTGVLLLRVNDTLTVAGLDIDELEAEELIFSAANAFADMSEHHGKGDTH